MVENVLRVPLERKHPDTALAQPLADAVRDEREVFHGTRRLGQPQGEVLHELDELGTHHQQVAELPLALLDARILWVLRFEAVLPALVRVEVSDLVDVGVRELVDLEDDGELLALAHEVVVEEEEGGDGGLGVRRVGARVVVCGEIDGGLPDGQGAVGLEQEAMFEQISFMSFV